MLDHIYSPGWKVSFYSGAIGKEPINGGREKMMPYAQSVLCSIWEKTERDPDGSFGVDVSEFANTNTVLTARITTGTEGIGVEQTLELSTVATYNDKDDTKEAVSYTRKRRDEAATWGPWERKD
jgi:hypothetical protein